MQVDKPMSFKAGTYKCMDLTFGRGNGIYGGILIRAMMNLNSKEYIEGPCNLLKTLLQARGVEECKDLKLKSWPNHDGDALDKDNGLAYL